MRILSIDPGYERLGIAILEKNPGDKKETMVYSDCFKTSAKLAFVTRLSQIGKELERLIDEYQPRALAIETLFFTNNQKTAMRVSEARGVIIYTMASRGFPVHEYTPLQIKVAVTGHGKSDKKQVIGMVPRLIDIKKEIAHDDEYDAIAIGLTCIASEYRR
jgi:crossover junction endodeoxyribonuclease RuvC